MARDGESSSSGEQSDPIDEPSMGKISEYEKQRLSRIAENKARLEAFGISKAALALMGPWRKRSVAKRNSGEEDDDYRPDDEEENDDDDEDEDEEFLGNSTCKRKVLVLVRY